MATFSLLSSFLTVFFFRATFPFYLLLSLQPASFPPFLFVEFTSQLSGFMSWSKFAVSHSVICIFINQLLASPESRPLRVPFGSAFLLDDVAKSPLNIFLTGNSLSLQQHIIQQHGPSIVKISLPSESTTTKHDAHPACFWRIWPSW